MSWIRTRVQAPLACGMIALATSLATGLGAPAAAQQQQQQQQQQQEPQEPEQAQVPPSPVLDPARRAAIARVVHRTRVDGLAAQVRDLVGQRLGPGYLPPLASLGDDGLPPARYATLVPPPSPLRNAWLSTSVTAAERRHPVFGYDGGQVALTAGIDTMLQEYGSGLVGIIGLHEEARYDLPADARLRTRSTGGGLYAGYALSETIVVDAMALWQGGRSQIAQGAAAGRFTTSRLSLSANLTAYLPLDAFQIAPSIGLSYVDDRQGGYVDSLGAVSPAQRIATTTMRAGVELSRGFTSAGGATLTPFASIGATYDIARRQSPTSAPVDPRARGDLAVGAGLRADAANGARLSLRVDVSGLADRRGRTVTAAGQVGFSF